MASTPAILGQAAPAAAGSSDLFTVAASKYRVVSTIIACNTNSTPTKIRVWARIAGAAAAVGNAVVYDTVIAGNEPLPFTIGMSFGQTDKLTVYSLDGGVTFTAFGTEGP